MKILIPVDGSRHSNAAVAFVASRSMLAGRLPVVDLLNVQYPIPPRVARIAGREMVGSYLQAEADGVLRPALAALRKAGIEARARYVVGSPGAAVGAAAAESKADLIVMGSRGQSAFRGLLLGSVTHAVLASCTKALLLLRGRPAPTRGSLTVGIAIDGSRYGLAAVRHAVKHRALFGAEPRFQLIHVVPDLSTFVIPGLADAPVPIYSPRQIAAAQNEAFERIMKPTRRLFARAGLSATEVCLTGNSPGDVIASWATREKLDILVLGSHGYGALKSAVLGSVATRAAARCRTPLLLVR